jgi:hypothetical protein
VTTTTAPTPATEEVPVARRARLGWMEPSKTAVALASAIVALLVSVPTGIYTLWPALSPDPKTSVAATLETVAFDRNVTLAEYIVRVPHQGIAGENPDQNGNVFYIRAKIEGFKREQLRVRWFTYEATNQVRVKGLRSAASLEQIFQPQAPVNTQVAEVWVPAPKASGKYYVRFHLYTKGNVLLSFVDSEVFTVEQL